METYIDNIWVAGILAGSCHFIASVLVGLVALLLIRTISSRLSLTIRHSGLYSTGLLLFMFCLGGLVHLYLDSVQAIF